MKTGPAAPRSTVLREGEEAAIVAFRRHTLLPLDDCLYALQPSIPHLTRSALHRCLQRHGISRLPDIEGDKPKRQKFKRYPIGFFHIDIAEVQTAEGKLYLFVGIDRTAKFAVVQLVETANRKTAWEFLEHLLESVPYQIHTILTDNGIQFAEQPRNRNTIHSRPMRFDMICKTNGIEHRLTKPNHPWTNGQVERMNRTIKDATVKRFHYETHAQLRTHLADFLAAYNFARRLKLSTAEQKWAKGQRKMLPLWGWHDCRIGVRQHPGDRAFHRAGGCPDALARKVQITPIWRMVTPCPGVPCFGRGGSCRRSSQGCSHDGSNDPAAHRLSVLIRRFRSIRRRADCW